MPNTYNSPILDTLRVGIAQIETGGKKNPYTSTAGDKNKDGKPDSTALGKYQFLKSYWWDRKGTGGKIDGFKEFAKKNEDVFGKIEKWEDISGNDALQEAYFSYYAENHLIPEARKALAKGNPLNLTLDQAAAVIHKQGWNAGGKAIVSGKFEGETDTNVSDARYLEVFNNAVKEAGYKNISLEDYTKNKANSDDAKKDIDVIDKKILKSKEDRVKEYIKRDKAISSNKDIDQATKERLRSQLYQDVAQTNDYDEFDNYIEEQNQQERGKAEAHKNLMKVFSDATPNYYAKKEGETRWSDLSTEWGSVEDMERVKKDFPELAPYIHIQKKDGQARIVVNEDRTSNDRVKEFTEKVDKVNKDYFGDNYKGTDLGKKYQNATATDIPGMFWSDMKTIFSDWGRNGIPKTEGEFKMNVTGEGRSANIRQKIDREKFKPLTPEIGEIEETPTPSIDDPNFMDSGEWADEKVGESSTDAEGLASQYFNQNAQIAREGADGQQFNYDASKQKRQIPVNAITGMALGILGNREAAEIDIPLRTEDVSQAVKNFTADLSKKSKQGLPPEVEAAMRNQLAEAYQGGLATLVNTSAGNRAAIMGNLGQLENAKSRGLVDMGLADYEAKERAFQQYGEAIKYINDFDARRDIANHGIQANEAFRQKQKAEQLATSGFAMLNEELQYQRENGPGSSNAMYRSMLMQRMFGFDPNMKDNGLGDTPGTKSYFDKNKARKKELEGIAVTNLEKFQSLSPEQKRVADMIAEADGGDRAMEGIVNYLHENPGADLAQIKAENLDLALRKNDFGLLGMNREDAMSYKSNAANPQTPQPEAPSLATPGINEPSITKKKQEEPLMSESALMQTITEQSKMSPKLLPNIIKGDNLQDAISNQTPEPKLLPNTVQGGSLDEVVLNVPKSGLEEQIQYQREYYNKQ